MAYDLRVQPFSADHLSEVQGFSCGEEPWQVEVAQWIKSSSGEDNAVAWIEKGTQVWLYKTDDGQVVGYGSLGKSIWRWPPPNGPREVVCIIPYFGLQSRYQGEPKDGPKHERFSARIMGDLIAKARLQGVRLLGLFVHKENHRAIGFYRGVGFAELPGDAGKYVRMVLDLKAE